MNPLIRGALILFGIFFIVMVFRGMVNKKITEFHAVFWLILGLGVIFCGIFPEFVFWIADILHVDYAPIAFVMIGGLVFLYTTYKSSMLISDLSMKVQELAMQVSLLNQENERIMDELMDLTGKDKKEI